MLFYPNVYQKDIFNIPYQKLKKKKIKCLIFDLDNTIAKIDEHLITEEAKKLLLDLKKDFKIVIISNNVVKRVKPYADILSCDYIANACKPLKKGFKKIKKKYNLSYYQMCMVGDQLITDIQGANRLGIYTVLVDPIAKKDLKITSLNRFLEKKILKKYEKKQIMKKGEYYS